MASRSRSRSGIARGWWLVMGLGRVWVQSEQRARKAETLGKARAGQAHGLGGKSQPAARQERRTVPCTCFFVLCSLTATSRA